MSSLFPRLDPSSSTLVDRRGKRSNYIYMECIKDRWLRPFGGYKTTERRILDHYANVVTLIAR